MADPLAGGEQALAMVPANHTDRYAVHIFIDKYWAGDVSAQAGGTKAACCFPGRKNWSNPISVTWEWGREEDAETKAITMPAEKHSAVVNFPAHGPHQDPNWRKSDAYPPGVIVVVASELSYQEESEVQVEDETNVFC